MVFKMRGGPSSQKALLGMAGTFYCVAFSGGLDSTALLYYLSELRQQTPLKLRAVHVHHGLSPNADAWALHCKEVCEALKIEYIEKRVTVSLQKGGSLEENAREARYAVFKELLQEDEILLTAHHQDDQAETLLLQLLRGAGLKGLSAMPVIKPFAKGRHARPLLNHSREDLHAYAVEKGLIWIQDESNENLRFSRNFIRHQILPQLKTEWPSVEVVLARAAAHCVEAQGLLEQYAEADCEKIKGLREGTLSVRGLLSLAPAKQRLLIRYWIQQKGFPLPDTKKLNTILTNVLTAAPDRMPCVKWGGVEVRRYRDDLYVMENSVTEMSQHQGGKKLKKLFQELGVPPWERGEAKLVYEGGKAVGMKVRE